MKGTSVERHENITGLCKTKVKDESKKNQPKNIFGC